MAFFLAWLWLFVIIITIITPPARSLLVNVFVCDCMEFRWDSIDSDSARPFLAVAFCLDLANVADWDDPPRIMHSDSI